MNQSRLIASASVVLVSVAVAALMLIGQALAATPVKLPTANLVKDPGAEAVKEPGLNPKLPGWRGPAQGVNVLKYGEIGGAVPNLATGKKVRGGKQFFDFGPPEGKSAKITQVVDVTAYRALIKQGAVVAKLSAAVGSNNDQTDSPLVTVSFLNASKRSLGTASVPVPTPEERGEVDGQNHKMITRSAPATPVPNGTAKIAVSVSVKSNRGGNDFYADNISVRLVKATS